MKKLFTIPKNKNRLMFDLLEDRNPASTTIDWLLGQLWYSDQMTQPQLLAFDRTGTRTEISIPAKVRDTIPTGELPRVILSTERRGTVNAVQSHFSPIGTSPNRTEWYDSGNLFSEKVVQPGNPLITPTKIGSENLASSSGFDSSLSTNGLTNGLKSEVSFEGTKPIDSNPDKPSPPISYTRFSNTPPVAANYNYSVVHDRELLIDDIQNGLLSNAYDADGDPLQALFVSEPTNGSIVTQGLIEDGGFSYIPDVNFVGNDSFTYVLWDGEDESTVATVTISVTNSNPVAASDTFNTNEDEALTGNVLANDSDADDDALQAVMVSGPSHGDLVLLDDGNFTYTPNVNYYGADSFTYTATDGVSTTSSTTVNLTIDPAGPFDLDGRDTSTLTPWMSEPDQYAYSGLGIDKTSGGTILTRVYELPSNYGIVSRRVTWDPNLLSINGFTYPGYIDLSPGGSNEQLSVSALYEWYDATEIQYEVNGTVETGGGGGEGGPGEEEGEEFAFIEFIQVKPAKAVLDKIVFTSDHNLIRQNTVDATRSGNRYSGEEFVRRPQYNAPITHTYDSKIELDLTFSVAGINAGDQIRIVGTSGNQALQFDSGVFAAPAGAQITKHLTATNKLNKDIEKITSSITWQLKVQNPGTGAWTDLAMGNSGAHKVYVLFGDPQNQNKSGFQVTDIRLDRTVDLASIAYTDAKANAAIPNEPTWQRIAYHVVQNQRFNLDRNVVKAPLTDIKIAKGWKVPEYWGIPKEGVDCISGATYSMLVISASGMPGTATADALVLKSAAEPTVAVSWALNDPLRINNNPRAELVFRDGKGKRNNFEATVIYTPPDAKAATYYFPVGTTARFISKNDVITVMTEALWVYPNSNTRVVINGTPVAITHTYQRANNASLD